MKTIRICFIMFVCLFVLTAGPGRADDLAEPAASPEASVTAPDTAPPQPVVDEAMGDEGDITYTADEPAAPTVTVIEARICESVSDREPVAPGDIFTSDIHSLFCFSRIQSQEDTEIKHVWYHDGEAVAEVPLAVGASSAWRTFSSKTITPSDKGNWKVDIVTASGTPVKTLRFIVN
ncbi:DUF2914 domain-containing protein [Desulfatiferula olefinivorans]